MEIFTIVLAIMATGGFFYLLITRSKESVDPRLDQLSQQFNQTTQTVLQQLNAVSKTLDERLHEGALMSERSHRSVGERLDTAAKAVTTVTDRLSALEESNKKIYEVGKDISSLQEILRAPKLRGNLGEFFLGDLLSQIFPKANFSLQYKFKTGAMVDAVIHLRDQMMVPVDAKFPLENFKRVIEADGDETQVKAKKVFSNDVKKHIDDIASKYILPDEGTFDFALMYVPAENVYYEVIVKDQDEKSISQYALAKRVIPVSPNSFYIYLQAILLGLRGLQIEKGAKEILNTLGRLQTDFTKFSDDFNLVGTHLGRAQNSYHSSEKRLSRFQDKLETIEGNSKNVPKLTS
ncbi:DNA recombination protein RmuC [Candidatus Peregrinibacteria bacterium]|jgi:DNA recombination protein RmuC|nr:DNA recombination protein RmuC [Candidatus Peregrinibacteria bacterium]MBT7483640.1 DNA recombination protein RmuC [Candidatus Peregrinibacteria bacterium]MBT7703844.1 DNA recombination protein RmuC [Candidatus Peregrinibacteria bacterium]